MADGVTPGVETVAVMVAECTAVLWDVEVSVTVSDGSTVRVGVMLVAVTVRVADAPVGTAVGASLVTTGDGNGLAFVAVGAGRVGDGAGVAVSWRSGSPSVSPCSGSIT
jgi:hypothetical protein